MDKPGAAPRLIAPDLGAPGETVRLAGEEVAHARARRLSPGQSVVLIDGSGREAGGRIERFTKAALDVAVLWVRAVPEPGPAIGLFVCGVRPERLDWTAEKATELGAARLVLVASGRSQSFRASPSRAERLARVVREAAKQCGSARWPDVSGPVDLAGALEEPSVHRIFLDFDAPPFPGSLAPAPAALLVGPEGGWSASERSAARAAGWTPASLPAGKLRAETAALAGLVLLRAAFVAAAV